jgi:hypothetical protein
MARSILIIALSLSYAVSGRAASTNPQPVPSPTPKKWHRLVIHPKSNLPPTRFEVVKVPGKTDKLEIHFVTTDPSLKLDTGKAIVIQLNTPRSLVLTPAIITSSEWPKGQTRMLLTYRGSTGKGVWIDGAATYTICKGKSCKKTETLIRTDFR